MATNADNLNRRSAGISYQELLASDLVPPPAPLTWENPVDVPTIRVPVSRYVSEEFHDREMRELWPRVWQMACREEEIPEIGDYYLYEIGHYSVIVVHAHDGIRAHHNICRHRAANSVTSKPGTRPASSARFTASAGTSTARCAPSHRNGISRTSTRVTST